jgi:hypothetical protein
MGFWWYEFVIAERQVDWQIPEGLQLPVDEVLPSGTLISNDVDSWNSGLDVWIKVVDGSVVSQVPVEGGMLGTHLFRDCR